ncbi:hypothetical protein B0H11DRAFT_2353697 [Mycena galericulata]|nr:hypothetical protein B0H11DRAFT_2353697 [Mycena galericulata]
MSGVVTRTTRGPPTISPPIFPPEITDLIIANLDPEDETTLKMCSLVCRAWVPACRHRLFSWLTISSRRDCEMFVGLSSALQNTYVYALQGMRLCGDYSKLDKLLPRLPDFSRLRTLQIYARRLDYECPLMPNVTSLFLSVDTFPSFSAFTGLLAQFSGLKVLSLRVFTQWERSNSLPSASTSSSPLDLDELWIHILLFEDEDFRNWLSYESLGLVTRDLTLDVGLLDLDEFEPRWAGGVSKFLRRLARLVEEVDFSANTALQTLRIGGAIVFMDNNRGDINLQTRFQLKISRWLSPLLHCFRYNALQVLTIGVDNLYGKHWGPYSPGYLENRVQDLADILKLPTYSGLRELQFRGAWDGQSHGAPFPPMLIEHLPHAAARVTTMVEGTHH